MCIEMRVERHNLRARCKHSQPRWFALECSGQACHMLHSDQQHAGSKGIGKPSKVLLIGNTLSRCWLR